MKSNIKPEEVVFAGHQVAFDKDGKPAVLTVRCVSATSLPQSRTYTQEELEAAFKKVASEKHWKEPIDAVIDADQKEVTDAAIAHFAYGFAQFIEFPDGRVRVTAPGYWGAEALMEAGDTP